MTNEVVMKQLKKMNLDELLALRKEILKALSASTSSRKRLRSGASCQSNGQTINGSRREEKRSAPA